MQYYENLTFSEFKKEINKLFENLVNKITKLKAVNKMHFEEGIFGSFKVINDKSAKYIGQFTYSPSNRQRNLKINFYQLLEVYKESFLKLAVQFEDFCKIILLHELGHAIDFNNNSVEEKPIHSFTNELACTLKNINEEQNDIAYETNKAILQINRYVKENIYMKERKANEIAEMLINKLEKNNHSLKRAFKIFSAQHKQYLEFEDIPIIRTVIAKRSISSPIQRMLEEYLGRRTNEKYRKIIDRIRQQESCKKENVFIAKTKV